MEVKEVAQLLNVHTNTIYNYINSGKIKAKKSSKNTWDISEEEVMKLKNLQSRTPRTIIESLRLTQELLNDEIKRLEQMLKNWNGSQTLEYLERYKNLKTSEYQVGKTLQDYELLVRLSYLEIDEVLDPELSSKDYFEYRHFKKKDEE